MPSVSTTRWKDKIFYEDALTQRQGIGIDPVPRETQLHWRRTFSEEQPAAIRTGLLAALDGPGSSVFNEFSRRLRENPPVMRAWNRFLQKQITDYVADWATANTIPKERWLAPSRRIEFTGAAREASVPQPPNISHRAELYNFFDQLPIEDLLELRVPLEWVLRATHRANS